MQSNPMKVFVTAVLLICIITSAIIVVSAASSQGDSGTADVATSSQHDDAHHRHHHHHHSRHDKQTSRDDNGYNGPETTLVKIKTRIRKTNLPVAIHVGSLVPALVLGIPIILLGKGNESPSPSSLP